MLLPPETIDKLIEKLDHVDRELAKIITIYRINSIIAKGGKKHGNK